MTDVPVRPGIASATCGARLALGVDNTVASGFTPIEQQVTRVEGEPYVVQAGFPYADSVHGGRINLDGGSTAQTAYPTAPLPETLDLGCWRRWLPYTEWLTDPAAGGRRWWPIETAAGNMVASGVGVSGVEEPRIALYTSVDPSTGDGTGRAVYGPLSPYIDPSYSFAGFENEMSRKAMVFDGAGHASIEVERAFTECTLGLVVVFHPSANPHYGVFASNEVSFDVGTPGEPLVLRYTHGRIDVFQANVKVVSHETHKNAHQAVIFLLSMSSTNDEGKLLVIDRTRTTRQFNIDNLDFVSFGGLIGAEGYVTTTDPVVFTAEMDLLDLIIWDSALSFAELEEKANLLSLAYGVAG